MDQPFVNYMDTPIGIIQISANDHQVLSIDFVQEKHWPKSSNTITQAAIDQLGEYFNGTRRDFNLPIPLSGTIFQQRVWGELLKIPYGETLSYGDIAKRIDNPKASRAVGNANNKNKISIVIPCHRVIGASGHLVGYGGELWRKKWLLDHEKKYKASLGY